MLGTTKTRPERVTSAYVQDMVITPDGKRALIALHDGRVHVWSICDGLKYIRTFKCGKTYITSLVLTPDGTRMVTCFREYHMAKVWDMRTGAELFCLTGVMKAVVTPDSSRLVTVCDDGPARVWDMQTGVELLRLEGGVMWAAVVTPDGKRIVTGSSDKMVRVWDSQMAKELIRLEGHTDGVSQVHVYGNNKIVTYSMDNTVRVWDIGTGAEILCLEHPVPIVSTAISGAMLVTCAYGDAMVWSLESGKLLATIPEPGPFDGMRIIQITPDGTRLAIVCGARNMILMRIWRTQDSLDVFFGKDYPGEAVVQRIVDFVSHS